MSSLLVEANEWNSALAMNGKGVDGVPLSPKAPGFEPEYFADFVSVLGTQAAAQWVDRLSALLVEAFSDDKNGPEYLRNAAHAMISQAGTLGFVELAKRSSRLEEAILAGGAYSQELNDVQREARRVSGALTLLKDEFSLEERACEK